MPVSRKRKTGKAVARKRRAKRKTVGARSAESGQFVEKEKLETEPGATVAVTREVGSEDQAPPCDGADEER